MSDSMITLQGWVGSEPVLRRAGTAMVANFRLGSTPRRFNRSSGEWIDDGATQWFTVNAWRQLGHNVKASLHKGDPVVVHGRLVARSWLNQGVETSAFEIEAAVVGHDLTKGCSLLQRNPRPASTAMTPEHEHEGTDGSDLPGAPEAQVDPDAPAAEVDPWAAEIARESGVDAA